MPLFPFLALMHWLELPRIKRNDLSIHITWMDLKNIMLSEKSQSQKIKYDSIYTTVLKRQNYRDEKKMSGCQGLGIATEGEGREECLCH